MGRRLGSSARLQRDREFWFLGALLLTGSSLSGCSVGAHASGSVNTNGEARAQAASQAESKPPPGLVETAPVETAPAEPPAIQLKQGRLEYRGVINFEYDRAALRQDAATSQTLAEFRQFLEKHPEVSLEIEGHTDSRGSEDYNLDLSERRALSLRDWLVANGIDGERLTAVGKGEGDPQVPESEACRNADGQELPGCEETWATNRRVVFEVTQGEETIEEPPPPPPLPAPLPAAPSRVVPAPEPLPACPWLFGGHLALPGPNSLVMVAAAVQPAVCWLEVSVGMGYGAGRYSASAAGLTARGHTTSFTFPLRATVWFMEQGHSLVGDLGLGVTHFRMKATAANAFDGSYAYTRNATPFLSTLALGYGWRPEGPQPGYRFTAMLGGVFHPTSMGDSSSDTDGPFVPAVADQLGNALDDRTEDYTDPNLFFEASLGLMF